MRPRENPESDLTSGVILTPTPPHPCCLGPCHLPCSTVFCGSLVPSREAKGLKAFKALQVLVPYDVAFASSHSNYVSAVLDLGLCFHAFAHLALLPKNECLIKAKKKKKKIALPHSLHPKQKILRGLGLKTRFVSTETPRGCM